MDYSTMREVRAEARKQMDHADGSYAMLLGALADYLVDAMSDDETARDHEMRHFQSCINRLNPNREPIAITAQAGVS